MRKVPPKGRGVKKERRESTKAFLRRADKAFSRSIIERDGKCFHPDERHAGVLTCSHYFSRGRGATRFDKENCITLCWWHHYKSKELGWEYQKQQKEIHGWDGQYTIFMRNWLGEERFEKLKARANTTANKVKAAHAFMEGLSTGNFPREN